MKEYTQLIQQPWRESNRSQKCCFTVTGLLLAVSLGLISAIIYIFAVPSASECPIQDHSTTSVSPTGTTTMRPAFNLTYEVANLSIAVSSADLARLYITLPNIHAGQSGRILTGRIDGKLAQPYGELIVKMIPCTEYFCDVGWEVLGSPQGGPEPDAELVVTHLPANRSENASCYEMSWKSSRALAEDTVFHNCYDIDNGSTWFAAMELQHKSYIINSWNTTMEPFLPRDSSAGQLGGILERYFLSSSGFAIYSDWNSPLFLSVNQSSICLTSQIAPPYRKDSDVMTRNYFTYYLCAGSDVATMHKNIIRRFYKKPSSMPDQSVFRDPIWSTFGELQSNLTQDAVLNFAEEIANNSFRIAHLEIDDSWTAKYGDLQFDTKRFPNATEMVRQLHSDGVSVTLWVPPFANVDSSSFLSGIEGDRMYWLKRQDDGKTPHLLSWQHGVGAVLDPSNPNGTQWFIGTLQSLTKTVGIAGFKFVAAETESLGSFSAFNDSLGSLPYQFTKLYATMTASAPGAIRSAVRVGCNTQDLPLLVCMRGKQADWSQTEGLGSIIPTALAFSLAGYPFVQPDIIGGMVDCNGSSECPGVLPDRELYTRWVELAAFLPVMKFSVAPWNYVKQVLTTSQNYTKLHRSVVFPYVEKAMNDSIRFGYPVIRPLWWLCPLEPACLACIDQFAIGDNLIVAPILIAKATRRTIILPPGNWLDNLTGQTYTIATVLVLKNYAITLNQIAYFTRVGS